MYIVGHLCVHTADVQDSGRAGRVGRKAERLGEYTYDTDMHKNLPQDSENVLIGGQLEKTGGYIFERGRTPPMSSTALNRVRIVPWVFQDRRLHTSRETATSARGYELGR